MKCDELKPVFVDMRGNIVANELGELYYKPEVDAAIAELKQKLENVQASMYADVVDANMENRRIRRALWIARAKRAIEKIAWLDCIDQGNPIKWGEMRRKCLKKAEEYK